MESIDLIDNATNIIALSLGKAMQTDIKYITYCFIRKKIDKDNPGGVPNVPVISCLGKDAVYFFRENFQKPFLIFRYSKIDHILIENKSKYTLMIVFNDDKDFFCEATDKKDNNVKFALPYIHLTIPDRNYFIENLMCYYSVYYISEIKIMKELVIKKRDKFIFSHISKYRFEYLKLFNMPPSHYKTLLNVNYLFFSLDQSSDESEVVNGVAPVQKDLYINEVIYEFTYTHKSNANANNDINNNEITENALIPNLLNMKAVFSVRLLRLTDITTLDSIELSKQKNYITNNQHILQLYAYEQFRSKNYEKIKKNKILILNDDKYIKKFNLSNDTCEWEGRVIKCYDLETCSLIHFFYLRRKFIAPFCDKYQDFIINCEQNMKIFQECLPKEEFEKARGDYILSENYELNKVLEMFINSIHNTDDVRVSQFCEILQYLYDTLTLDYNSLNYFTNNIEIIGKEIYLIGLKFVYFFLKAIKKLKDQIDKKDKENFHEFKTNTNINISNLTNLRTDTNTEFSGNVNTRPDKHISVKIEDFLENLDFIMELYVQKHDHILASLKNRKNRNNKNLRDMNISGGVLKWIFKEIMDQFIQNGKKEFENDAENLSQNWQIRIKKFAYFCLNGGLLPGTIDMGTILDLFNHHISYDTYLLREILIDLLFFDNKIDIGKFSLSSILSLGNELVFNHELLCLIIERGYIDVVFSTNERMAVFSGEILSFLLQSIKSFEIINAIQNYFYDLILQKDQRKISVIAKQRQNIIKELFEVFRDENINPYIIIKISKIFNSLIYLDPDQLKTITALINKNIVDVIVYKLNTNNLNLTLGLTALLKSLTNKIEASNIKSSFTKNIDPLIKNVTKLIQLNGYYRNCILLENLITIHINFVVKGNDNQKFYLMDIKNSVDKQKCLVGTLMNLFFDNLLAEENFVKNENKMAELKEKFEVDIKILTFFQCLIKNYKQMKSMFKDKNELDFFCSGINGISITSNNNPQEVIVTQNNRKSSNTNNNMNNSANNLKKNENPIAPTKFNNKMRKLNNIIKNKIMVQSAESSAFAALINKYSFPFIVSFYRFVSNIVEFCFYLLNEDEVDIKKNENVGSHIFCLRELSGTIGDLLKSVPHANNATANHNANSKAALDRLLQAHEALNRHLEAEN